MDAWGPPARGVSILSLLGGGVGPPLVSRFITDDLMYIENMETNNPYNQTIETNKASTKPTAANQRFHNWEHLRSFITQQKPANHVLNRSYNETFISFA